MDYIVMDTLRLLIYRTRLFRLLDFLDFALFLNVLKYLPVRLAEKLSALRGSLRYLLDLDWRSSCLGHPFIRGNTAMVYSTLISPPDVEKAVRDRFVHQSREEMEAKLHTRRWPRKVEYENLHAIQDVQQTGRGLILLTAHFDSSIAGAAFLGDLGYNVNLFVDEIVYDDRVPAYFQNHFRNKYNAMQDRFNNGVIISQKSLRESYRRLQNGEILVWLYDSILGIPGDIDVDLIKKPYRASDSVLKIARKTGSYIGANTFRSCLILSQNGRRDGGRQIYLQVLMKHHISKVGRLLRDSRKSPVFMRKRRGLLSGIPRSEFRCV
jgi:lauroyl/myristoyl acyltransferase